MKFLKAVLPLAILSIFPGFTAGGTILSADDVPPIKRVH